MARGNVAAAAYDSKARGPALVVPLLLLGVAVVVASSVFGRLRLLLVLVENELLGSTLCGRDLVERGAPFGWRFR